MGLTEDGTTLNPFQFALGSGQASSLISLLEHCGLPDGHTMFDGLIAFALRDGDLEWDACKEVIDALLSRGADINSLHLGLPPLSYAKSEDQFRFLIERKADVNFVDKSGLTIFHHVLDRYYLDSKSFHEKCLLAFQILIEAGASPKTSGSTPNLLRSTLQTSSEHIEPVFDNRLLAALINAGAQWGDKSDASDPHPLETALTLAGATSSLDLEKFDSYFTFLLHSDVDLSELCSTGQPLLYFVISDLAVSPQVMTAKSKSKSADSDFRLHIVNKLVNEFRVPAEDFDLLDPLVIHAIKNDPDLAELLAHAGARLSPDWWVFPGLTLNQQDLLLDLLIRFGHVPSSDFSSMTDQQLESLIESVDSYIDSSSEDKVLDDLDYQKQLASVAVNAKFQLITRSITVTPEDVGSLSSEQLREQIKIISSAYNLLRDLGANDDSSSRYELFRQVESIWSALRAELLERSRGK